MHYIRVLWLYFSDKEAFGGLLLSPPCDVMMMSMSVSVSWNAALRVGADESALSSDAAAVRRLDHCDAVQLSALFDDATADRQSEIIRHRLRALQRRLADEDYAALAHLFRRKLRVAIDSATAAAAAAVPRRASDGGGRGRTETLARRAMFSTVVEMESRLGEVVARRGAYVRQQTALHYRALLSGLIQRADDFDTSGTNVQVYFRSLIEPIFDLEIRIQIHSGDAPIVGPIPWGHSGPLCHALSLSLSSLSSWTSMHRRRATVPVATPGEWACGKCFLFNFVIVYTIAYRVHVYTRASLIHSPNATRFV